MICALVFFVSLCLSNKIGNEHAKNSTRSCQKIQKIDKNNSQIDKLKKRIFILLKSWRNFNEMLGENVAYNNVKNDLKTVSPFFLEIFFWEKP